MGRLPGPGFSLIQSLQSRLVDRLVDLPLAAFPFQLRRDRRAPGVCRGDPHDVGDAYPSDDSDQRRLPDRPHHDSLDACGGPAGSGIFPRLPMTPPLEWPDARLHRAFSWTAVHRARQLRRLHRGLGHRSQALRSTDARCSTAKAIAGKRVRVSDGSTARNPQGACLKFNSGAPGQNRAPWGRSRSTVATSRQASRSRSARCAR